MSPDRPIRSSGSPLNSIGGIGPKSKPAIPDHELLRCIGEGAYGEVWLARNVLGTYRAIKIVYRKSFREERAYEREFRGIQQFEPISRTNDGLLDVLQAGRNDGAGYYYYVMELADDAGEESEKVGEWASETGALPTSHSPTHSLTHSRDFDPQNYTPRTLATLRHQGRLPPAECVRLGLSLTLALGHLHRNKLIHRDIKPANIIFVQGIPKLADIGLVTSFADSVSFVGTEGFIAPEGPTSPRADLYSLGKVLYEISTGRDRKDFPEPPTGLGETSDARELAELNAVILRACASDAQDRYQTAEEFHADLALLNSGRSVMWKRVVERRLAFARKAGAAVGLIAVLALGGYLYQRHQTQYSQYLLAQMRIQKAEGLFEGGDSPLALAHLADVLRRHRDHRVARVAAERLMSVLAQRNFPRRLTQPLAHTNQVITAHFSPDAQSVVTTADDHAVRLWNAQTGQEIDSPHWHRGPVNSVEFSPNGAMLLTASDDGTAGVLDARTVAIVFSLEHGAPVNAATFSPNGAWVATAGDDGKVRRFNAETGELLFPPLEHTGPVNAVTFSPNGQYLATATEGGRVRIWVAGSGQLKHPRFAVNGPVRLLRFSGDGKRLAATVRNYEANDVKKDWLVLVWDVETGQPVSKPLVHDRVTSLNFSPDGQHLATADVDKLARVWEVTTGKILFELRHSAVVNSVEFSPDGRLILTASSDHTARVWDASNGAPVSEPMLHEGQVMHAEFSRHGEWVLTAGREDKTVKLWSVRPSRPPNVSLRNDFWVVSAEFDANNSEAITTTSGEISSASGGGPYDTGQQQSIIVWDTATGTPKFKPPLPKGDEAVTAGFTKPGPMALIVDRNDEDKYGKRAWISDLSKGGSAGKEIHHEEEITCGDFSADGLKLATGSEDGIIKTWVARTAIALTRLVHKGSVRSVRFSPDGTRLVTTSDDGTAMIWDAVSGARLAGRLRHNNAVWFAQFSPKGDKIVTVSKDYTAKIWSMNGVLLATLSHSAPVEYAEFSPDGTKVVTASGDRTARIWSVATGKQLTELQHGDFVMTARFSLDGLRVITASKDRTAQVWDVATGLKLGDPFRHGDWVISASFSPDGRHSITASLDKTAKIWEVPVAISPIPPWLPELAEAVGGQRLNPDRISEAVSWTEYAALKARLMKASESDARLERYLRVLGESGVAVADSDQSDRRERNPAD
jgi:WD40 repeat protein